MTKQQLLLVDGDPRTLHVLETSLRGAGFAVMTAGSGQAALARCRVSPPDLVVTDTAIPGMDGFQLCQTIKADEQLKDTPVVFLSGHGSVEEKVRGLELGAEDYLTKPIDTREFVARVRLLIEKQEKERQRGREQRANFSGSLGDLSMAELLQTLEIGRKSGVVSVVARDGRTATLWVQDGAVVDATAGRRRGETAFYWALRWREGRFSIQFGAVDREATIETATQHLLLEGMRRLDEWEHALSKLPSSGAILQVDYLVLSDRAGELSRDCEEILRLVDGRRTLARVLEETEADELAALNALRTLIREEVVRVAPSAEGRPSTPPPLPGANAPVRSQRRLIAPSTTGPWPGLAGPLSNQATGWSDAAEPTRTAERALAHPPPLPTPARGAGAEPEPDPPRLVRFSLDPRIVIQVSLAPTARARRPAAPERAPALAGALDPTPRDVASRPVDVGRRPAGRLALAVLLLVLAGGFLAWRLARRPEPPRPPAVPVRSVPAATDGYDDALAEARRARDGARYADEVTAWRRATTLRPTSAAFEGLGKALRDAGDGRSALEALQRAIELDPRNASAYIAVARMHADARRVDEARAAWRRYLALEPQGAAAREAEEALRGAR